jgi:hypothetical protein
LPRAAATFASGHRTVLAGWRAASSRRPALPDCALIIPARGRGDDVERLLDTLLAIPDAPGEVVVVDSGPARDLDARLRAWTVRSPAPFALVYAAGLSGPARQRNIGVDLSGSEFIFFLEPNYAPLPGYFHEIRRVFEVDRMGCVGGVCGLAAAAGMPPPGSQRRDPLIYDSSGDYQPAERCHPFSGMRRVDVLPASACAWRREVFADFRFSGLFQREDGREDIELSLRAGKSWTLLCCGDARAQRLEAESRSAPPFHDGRAQIRNRHLIWKRHVRRPALRHTARFWARAFGGAGLDLASWCARPWRLSALARAAGAVAGIAECAVKPAVVDEPPARLEYVLETEVPRAAAKAAP